MSLVKFSLEISTTYKSICVKITHKQQEVMSNNCDKSRYATFAQKSEWVFVLFNGGEKAVKP